MNTKTNIHGILIDNITMKQAMERVSGFLEKKIPHSIFTPNAEIIMSANRDKSLMDILNASDMLIADGAGVVLGSKLLGTRLPEKVSGIDLCKNILLNCKTRSTSFYLFGGKPGVAELAAKNIQNTYPGALIKGYRDGYFKDTDIPTIIKEINASGAEVLLVALGVPKQELWIHQNKHLLNVKVCMGVGGTLDVLSGTVVLAPEIMRRNGLEWLYRLYKEPYRYKRMMDLPRFIMLTLKVRVSRVFRGKK